MTLHIKFVYSLTRIALTVTNSGMKLSYGGMILPGNSGHATKQLS